MHQPMYECPFCNEPALRTRYLFWRHIHECLRKQATLMPDITIPQSLTDKENLTLIV
ncbi:MAG: hypothetical protein GX799_03910 [Crenarchaeota archaeon]|nr:hypothetical protein [Thermoproteota archaeon]